MCSSPFPLSFLRNSQNFLNYSKYERTAPTLSRHVSAYGINGCIQIRRLKKTPFNLSWMHFDITALNSWFSLIFLSWTSPFFISYFSIFLFLSPLHSSLPISPTYHYCHHQSRQLLHPLTYHMASTVRMVSVVHNLVWNIPDHIWEQTLNKHAHGTDTTNDSTSGSFVQQDKPSKLRTPKLDICISENKQYLSTSPTCIFGIVVHAHKIPMLESVCLDSEGVEKWSLW